MKWSSKAQDELESYLDTIKHQVISLAEDIAIHEVCITDVIQAINEVRFQEV